MANQYTEIITIIYHVLLKRYLIIQIFAARLTATFCRAIHRA
jgi:hypothetical protein